jgi:DNA recombination protein RmuC
MYSVMPPASKIYRHDMHIILFLFMPFLGGLFIGGGMVWLVARARFRSEGGLSDHFKALAADTLRANSEAFLRLAETRLKQSEQAAASTLDKKTTAFDEMVKPVRESLQKMDAQLQALEVKREGAYSEVVGAVKISNESMQLLRGETSQLLQALHSPTARGNWGQIQLKRIFEMAGMAEHLRDFSSQYTVEGDDGSLRPDYIVSMSGDRNVIFDCKVPLTAYLEYSKCTDETARQTLLEQHAKHVREHIRALSAKEYWKYFKEAPEFVVLFMPEHLLGAALDNDPELFDYGIQRKIILATQTTVLAIMWSVAYGWKEEALRENVQKIGAMGGELYAALATMTEHIDALRSKLAGSLDSYNKFVGSFEHNVLSKARKLKDFGAAKGGKVLPEELEPIDLQPRALTAEEPAARVDAPPPVQRVGKRR